MIQVIDYGLGNITSVARALQKIGAEVVISSSPGLIFESSGIVLPGVGAFKKAMLNLEKLGLIKPIKDYLLKGKNYLGICLGLQVLFTESHEHGVTKGFGVIEGSVEKLPFNVKIPHMGWNNVTIADGNETFKGVEDNSYFYFDHSYIAVPVQKKVISGVTEYGSRFASAVEYGNVWGVQFHPEKSGDKGLRILENFYRKTRNAC